MTLCKCGNTLSKLPAVRVVMHPCRCGAKRGKAHYTTPMPFEYLKAGPAQYAERKKLGLPVMTEFEIHGSRDST